MNGGERELIAALEMHDVQYQRAERAEADLFAAEAERDRLADENRGRQRIAAMAATPIEGPCEADIVAVCTGTAEHRHHKRRRSQGGSDDRSNLLLCCHACHQWTHANPREARALGFLVFGVDVWSQP